MVDLHAVDRRDAGAMLNPVFAPMLAPLISNGSDGNNQASETFETSDRKLAADASGFIQQLFNPTPALESSSHPTHRRPLTPTQEALHIQLQNIGLVSKNIMPTDYLEAAQRYLYETTRQNFPSRKITAYPTFTPMGSPDKFSEPGLSDASSDSNEQQTEPTTPDGTTNLQAYPNTSSYMLPLGPNIADHTKGNQAMGAAIQPSHNNTMFPRNGPIKSTGQIDPYIPAVVENDPPKSGVGIQPGGCWSAKYQRSNNKHPIVDYGVIYNMPKTTPGVPYVNMQAAESFGVPDNCSNHNCNSADCFHNQLRIQNEHLTGKMQHYESLLRSSKEKLEYACSQALTNITIREAEIAKLRLQLRQQGLRPCSEPEGSEDLFFEKELSMLFRMLCCWGKRFYKFPTGELHSLPQNLHNFITEICEDKSNESYLMATHQTKYLVVVAMASRWMVEKILNPQFLDMAVGLAKAAVSRQENGPYRGRGDIIRGISRFSLLA